MQRLAAVDVEATCLDPRRCRVVAAALVPVRGSMVDLSSALYAVALDAHAGRTALVHGITGGESRVKPNTSIEKLLAEAANYTLITYGPHDARLLAAESVRRGMERTYCYIDILGVLLSNPARRTEAATRGHYSLEQALQEIVGIETLPRRLHDPLEDAVYAALLYLALSRQGLRWKTRCVGQKPLLGRLARKLFRLPHS